MIFGTTYIVLRQPTAMAKRRFLMNVKFQMTHLQNGSHWVFSLRTFVLFCYLASSITLRSPPSLWHHWPSGNVGRVPPEYVPDGFSARHAAVQSSLGPENTNQQRQDEMCSTYYADEQVGNFGSRKIDAWISLFFLQFLIFLSLLTGKST